MPSPTQGPMAVLGPTTCGCEYQITDVTLSSLSIPTGYGLGIWVATEENCTDDLNCRYFEYIESECPESFFPVSGCYDLESLGASKPTAWYHFNCNPALSSDLNALVVQTNFFNSTTCVPHTSIFPTGTAKVKFRCSDPVPPACGLGYTFGSKEFTLNFNGTPVNVQLSGCGCQLPI